MLLLLLGRRAQHIYTLQVVIDAFLFFKIFEDKTQMSSDLVSRGNEQLVEKFQVRFL